MLLKLANVNIASLANIDVAKASKLTLRQYSKLSASCRTFLSHKLATIKTVETDDTM